jgi:transposase
MGAPGVRLPSAGVWLALEPVDMRCGMERLSSLVQHALGRTPCGGGGGRVCDHARAVELAGDRHRLAASVRSAADAVGGVKTGRE